MPIGPGRMRAGAQYPAIGKNDLLISRSAFDAFCHAYQHDLRDAQFLEHITRLCKLAFATIDE